MSNQLITVNNISFEIAGNRIIHDLSFDIRENTIVSIIGYNGSGKSTLLTLLLGSITPSTGSIERSQGLRVGYVPQKLSFNQRLPITARNFLRMYNRTIKATDAFECKFLDIHNLLDKPLGGLSGGQLQKVLIYNALLGNPDILLLDEPTAGLDVVAQEGFYGLLEHIHQDHGLTMVLVSHDIHTVYSKSDMVVCLHEGMCCSGSPHDERFSQELTDLFGGYVRPYLHTHAHRHDG